MNMSVSINKLLPKFLKNSGTRDMWVLDRLKELPAGTKLLDAGAGEGRYKKFCGHLQYTSQDFGQYDGKGDGTGLHSGSWNNSHTDIISDITSIPVSDASYDAILCTEVLEHVPYPDIAIKEFSRILKSGGKLILTSPFNSLTHMAPFHFSTGFSKYWYEKVASDTNMIIELCTANGNYFDVVLQELSRVPSMIQKHSKLGVLAYMSYLFIVPCVGIIYLLSKLTRDTEYIATFGFMIVARKK